MDGACHRIKDMTVQWDTAVIPMKEIDSTIENSYAIEDSEAVHDATERIKKILDTKCEPADLDEVVSACMHLINASTSKILRFTKCQAENPACHAEIPAFSSGFSPNYEIRAYSCKKIFHAHVRVIKNYDTIT